MYMMGADMNVQRTRDAATYMRQRLHDRLDSHTYIQAYSGGILELSFISCKCRAYFFTVGGGGKGVQAAVA